MNPDDLLDLLEKQTRFGHTAMRRNKVETELRQKLPAKPAGVVVHTIGKREYFQLGDCDRDESQIASAIQTRLGQSDADTYIDHDDVEDSDIVLDEQQRVAVEVVCNAPIACLTGPPGVGKTTILDHALHHLEREGESYALCALSGKAAQRMHELTGKPASTIHRLLGWNGRRFIRQYLAMDVVIIDEASMVDSWLLGALLSRCSKSTRIVMIGDVDQLPPVGAGHPFYDIIASGIVPTTRLRTLYRQSEQSWVCRNAPRIIAGDWDAIELGTYADFELKLVPDEKQLSNAVNSVVVAADHLSWQVLSPQKNIAGGTIQLNRVLAGDHAETEAAIPIGSTAHGEYMVYYGDRVMQMRNDYTLRVMNGTVGRVIGLDRRRGVDVEYPDHENGGVRIVQYTRAKAKQLVLAYATTVHKFQGSEANDVVIVCHSNISTNLLTRQVMYTAVTRAKKKLTIVGTVEAFRYAVANNKPRNRQTMLGHRLRGEISPGLASEGCAFD